mgnify:FL=1
MSSELSKLMLARGFDLKQNVKDRRDADSNQKLAQLLQQGKINQNQAQTEYYNKQSRGQQLENTQLAQKMARGPQNTFELSKGNDGNLYKVEYDPQGNPMNSALMEGMGNSSPTFTPTANQKALAEYLTPEEQVDLSKVTPAGWVAGAKARKTRTAQSDAPDDKTFERSGKLRAEITKLSTEFRKTENAYARIQASAQDPSAAGDMALIFNYMKMLDPGSTVREGEFATAQQADGVDGRVINAYNQALNGQRLNDAQRTDFMGRSKMIFDKGKTLNDTRTEGVLKFADKFGIDRTMVVSPSVSHITDEELDAELAKL